jgi:hypothetical protein
MIARELSGAPAKAFNLGSDARLAGLPLAANPYQEPELHDCWWRGWQHVAKHWPRQLPPVPEESKP